jgi:hypothetical protein
MLNFELLDFIKQQKINFNNNMEATCKLALHLLHWKFSDEKTK